MTQLNNELIKSNGRPASPSTVAFADVVFDGAFVLVQHNNGPCRMIRHVIYIYIYIYRERESFIYNKTPEQEHACTNYKLLLHGAKSLGDLP